MSVLKSQVDRCDVVLLHSMGLDAEGFEPVSDALGPTVATWAIDLWGHGYTPMREPMDLDAVADDVAAVIETSGTSVVLAGVSYGGLVAQVVAARHPETVRHLVLANTFSNWPEAATRRDTYRQSWEAAGSDEAWYLQREKVALVPDADARSRELYALGSRRNSPASFFATAPTVFSANVDSLWDQIRCLVTVVTGEYESRIPLHVTAELAKLAGVDQPIVLAGANHLTYLERPQEFAAIISDCVRRSGP
jgi:3-oxoadipate enol-lactonase